MRIPVNMYTRIQDYKNSKLFKTLLKKKCKYIWRGKLYFLSQKNMCTMPYVWFNYKFIAYYQLTLNLTHNDKNADCFHLVGGGGEGN